MKAKLKIKKLQDTRYKGSHPNGIYEGYEQEGEAELPPVVGQQFVLKRRMGVFTTSKVTEIVNENVFTTENSTYRIDIVGDTDE